MPVRLGTADGLKIGRLPAMRAVWRRLRGECREPTVASLSKLMKRRRRLELLIGVDHLLQRALMAAVAAIAVRMVTAH